MKIPVLLYHRIANNKEECLNPYIVSVQDFECQMRFLKSRQWITLSLEDLFVNYPKYKPDIQEDKQKYVIITFDDGYLDNYRLGFPVLQKYGHTATCFCIISKLGSEHFMHWHHLKELIDAGLHIGSHTLNHYALRTVDVSKSSFEINRSKQILSEKLGVDINFLSFPHGSYNHGIINEVQNAGYLGSCNSNFNYYNKTTNPFMIGRIVVRPEFSLEQFKQIITGRGIFQKNMKARSVAKEVLRWLIGDNFYNAVYDRIYHSNVNMC